MPENGGYKEFQRPQKSFRLDYALKTNALPDAMPPGKTPVAENVRSYQRGTVTPRPGFVHAFSISNVNAITDMKDYIRLSTSEATRILSHDVNDRIYIEGTYVETMASGSYGGAVMLPFRPSASPDSYIYVTNGADYRKYSAPSAGGTVTPSKVGIAEPPSAPDAIINDSQFLLKGLNSGLWTNAGTAGAPANSNRVSDTIQVGILPDPALASNPQLYSLGVTASNNYQPGMYVLVAHGVDSNADRIEAVFPAIPAGTIQSIRYYSGTTGHCVVVPNFQSLQNTPGAAPSTSSAYDPVLIANLARGALVQLGAELCYVWSVTRGPNGVLSFETSTTINHAAGVAIQGITAIQMHLVNSIPWAAGDTITVTELSSAITVGTGTLTAAIVNDFFSFSSFGAAQQDDYLHASLYVSDPTLLTEAFLQADVGDGSYTKDYYYVAIRPNDLTASLSGGVSQLAAAQTIAQRISIDAGIQALSSQQILQGAPQATANAFQLQQEALNAAQTVSSIQLSAAPAGVWTELWIPLRLFTKVGTNRAVSLLNANSLRLSVTASGSITVALSSVWQGVNGFQPDVGPQGSPYYYRVRPRSKVTGARGNPSPATRYGANPRRQPVTVTLPSASYDTQIDTWDVFRYGGTLTEWRYLGSADSTATSFTDNFFDTDALGGEALDFDNYEPWPTVGLPLNDTASVVCGTLAIIPATYTDVLRMLPGTLVQIAGNQVFTLRKRPVSVSGGVQLEFIESASPATNVEISIPEPALARQTLPYIWGPDARGTIFGCGDPLRPGTLYMSKPYFPDSAPEYATIELCPPSEPLQGGEVIDGVSVGFSTRRAWRLYPGGSWQAQVSGITANVIGGYTPVQYPVGRGLAAPYAHCTDGKVIYFWGPDGIYTTTTGAAQSLTYADLSNLFPHEGVDGGANPELGTNFTYGGHTVPAPDYSRSQFFRLTWANDYLFADYPTYDGTFHSLVCDLRRGGDEIDPHWSIDTFGSNATYCHLYPAQPENSVNPVNHLYRANSAGDVYYESGTTDSGVGVSWALAVAEFTGDDERAANVWGDIYVDVVPQSAITCQPMYLGAAVPGVSATVIPAGTSRVQTTVTLNGGVLLNFIGLMLSGTDGATVGQTLPTQVNLWQPSLLPQPESIADRFTDWDDAGNPGAKYIQGFLLECDTSNAAKSILVRNGDSGNAQQTFSVTHNGQQTKAYSFDSPFIAHLVRLEPQNAAIPWRLFGCKWVWQPTPETVTVWQTQRTAHGLRGYMHVRQVMLSYASSATVTLTITAFDGTSPATITLPSTGGIVEKVTLVPTFNKGLLFSYGFTSAQNFQIFQDDCEVLIGSWDRQGDYLNYPLVGGKRGDQAAI